MNIDLSSEETFEVEIAEYLAANGWLHSPTGKGYDAQRALFPEDVLAWLEETQPEEFAKVVTSGSAAEAKQRVALLDALAGKLNKAMLQGGGTLNVLRRGFSHINARFSMCQFRPPTTLNPKTVDEYSKVRLRVVRQVSFSPKAGDLRRLDLVFFINGIPVATVELKSSTKQDAAAAVQQYKKDRDPSGQPLLGFGRALVHFALDDDEVWMTTQLAGERTHFLPFNRGLPGGMGKGNPTVEGKSATSYLWERVLQRDSWLGIVGQLMFVKQEDDDDPIGGRMRKRVSLIFPRFHQWEAVNNLVGAVSEEGTGNRYLIQHSAGSGKTNTISWTAYRLSRLHDASNSKVFDKVIIVSDRKVLDKQLQDAILQIDPRADAAVQVIDQKAVRESSDDAHSGSKSRALGAALSGSALIVVVTIQTFPAVLGLLGGSMADKRFAIIVDEAHTSQSGNTAVKMRQALTESTEVDYEDDESAEDFVNAQISSMTALRAASPNISYFAFTATPKAKTIELFGRVPGVAGDKPLPFHLYSMRQAIEEGFILDVLRGYQTYDHAFQIELRGKDGVVTSFSGGAVVDSKAASRGIMRFAKLHPTNVGQKVEIIVEHFIANVSSLLDGQAKAMVVTDSRQAALRYKVEIDRYIAKKGYGLKTIVAFSGKISDPDYGILDATESSMNPGLGSDLAAEFRRSDYRVMLVADKFQTGFDQPLLCAMYVDKKLPEVHAVQTLSRLNRTYRSPNGEVKDRTFVLDFRNKPADIQAAFEPYYTEAHVESTTDPNTVHSLADKLLIQAIFSEEEVRRFALAWYGTATHGAVASAIRPAKLRFATAYASAKIEVDSSRREELELFRKDAGSFVRLYDFMSQIIDYGSTDLEKLALFLRHLVPELEVDRLEDDVDLQGIILTRSRQIDRGSQDIGLDGNLDAAVGGGMSPGEGVVRPDPEMKLLSEVVDHINELFGGELGQDEIEGFVRPVTNKVIGNPSISDQIRGNAEDQFLDSPDLRDAVIDAALTNKEAITKLTSAATGEDALAEDLIRAIGRYAWALRREQGDLT